MTCPHCQAPERTIYGPGKRPTFAEVRSGNWIALERCDVCGALWCSSPYEPYAAFEYVVRWERSPEAWSRLHDADSGRALLRWHAAVIREQWRSLPAAERENVEVHRRRSRGHNPIDNTTAFGAGESRTLLGE